MNKNQYITKTFTYNGQRYYVRAKTEVEAIKKMALKQRDLEEEKPSINANLSLTEWAEICFVSHPLRAKTTQDRFEWTYKHYIMPELGRMKLKNILPLHCNKFLASNMSGFSTYIINQTCQVLNYLFKFAKLNHLIQENPMEMVTRPKGFKNSRRAMTDQEEKAFLKVVNENPRFIIFELMYHCGCRPSEARNVLGEDISILDGFPVLHIRGTKTKNADRYVPIPPELYEKIKDLSGLIAHTTVGSKYDEKAYQRVTHALYRAMNIEMGCKVYRNELIPPFPLADDFCPYCLRHTYCTNLCKKNVDIRIAQKLMGHSDISLTANIYTTIDNSLVLSAAKIIGATVGATP